MVKTTKNIGTLPLGIPDRSAAQLITTAQTSTSNYPALDNFQEKIGPRLPMYGGVLLACAALYGWSKHRRSKTNVLGKGGLGDKAVLKRARTKGLQELGTTLGKTCIWLGDPKTEDATFLRKVLPGVLVEGGPDAGKSYSFFNQAMISVIQQRFGCVIVDFKYPKQTARIADFAQHNGYEVGVLAPTFEESQTLNPILLLRDGRDTLRAEEFIRVAKLNLSKGAKQDGSNKFWDDLATQILTGAMCMVRDWEYPDIMSLRALLTLDELPDRLRFNRHKISPAVYTKFEQLFSSDGANRQMAALKSSYLQLVDALTVNEFLPSIVGSNTVPMDIGPGKMLIVGVNRNYRETLGPLLGALTHTVIENNINEQRESPLVFCCDELPGLYWDKIHQWLAEGREDGFLAFLGIQAHSQMVDRYGEQKTETIYTSLPSKLLMNPNNPKRAEGMAKWGGKIDVKFETKGDGSSKQGRSKNYTGHLQSIDAVQPSEITRLNQGEAIIVSPGFESGDGRQSFIPVRKKLIVPQNSLNAIQYSESRWESHVRPELIEKNRKSKFTDEDMRMRIEYADAWLPKPPEEDDDDNS